MSHSFSHMYPVSQMTLVHAKQAMFLGSFAGLWSGSAFGDPAVAPGDALRRPLEPLVTQPAPLCHSSGDQSVAEPLDGEVCCASCQGLARVCCCCCGSDTTENMGLSTVPGTGSSRKLPSGHLSPGPRAISLIFSFFSPQTCSRGSAPWKAEVWEGGESRGYRQITGIVVPGKS